ncbi:MAG TPA: pilus assembly protein PilX [Methylococcaceae bacterium]|nr:pilus assembly protein PilX [Methylococcaceae bacterium]
MKHPHSLARQTGSVLIISLIMLLLLTLAATTSMQVTSLEERMAGNMRNRNLAFQAAESALRAGENILTQAALPNFTNAGDNGLYAQDGAPPGAYDAWPNNNTAEVSGAIGQVAVAPRYVIQRMANVESGASLDAGEYGQSEMYRVTARGVGGTETAVVVLQSTYKR